MGNQMESTPANEFETLNTPTFVTLPSNSFISTTDTNSLQLPEYDSCPSRSISPRVPPSLQTPKKTAIISTKIVQIAADFWNNQMNALSFEQQLEIGVALYLGMMVKDNRVKQTFQKKFNQNNIKIGEKIEKISLKFVNVTGWLIRTILRNDDNLSKILSDLGAIHGKIGVNSKYYAVMIESLHETFSYYFPDSYKIQEKYAIDYTFKLATKMMMGQTIKPENEDYLKNLDVCLKSTVGRAYLFKYLQQTCCDEIVIYLKSIMKFQNQTTDKGRFMIAKNIVAVNIDENSNFALNLSYETRQNMLAMMEYFEHKFVEKEEFCMSSDVFQNVTYEIYRLVMQNHWNKFVKNIKTMNENNCL